MPKYLIIKPSSLGDIVHALIVAQALKAQSPASHITWVVRKEFAGVLRATSIIDEVITFDRKGGPKEFFRLLGEIRKNKYDATLDMQGLLRTGLMNLAARAPLKLCRRDQREGAQLFANKIVNFPANGSRHAVDMLMEFLPPLGLKPMYAPLKLKEEVCWAKNTELPRLPAGCVLIFPSSRGKWAVKEWPKMAELTDRSVKRGIPVAWCSDEVLAVPAGAMDFCKKVSLANLMPFMAQATIVVGNDSGPTHMAAALGLKTVGLYGPTLPERAGAYPLNAENVKNIHAKGKDISKITVETVMYALEQLLQ